MGEVARIDKWLWAARIFKTRSIAADACKNGRVTIKGVNVKPSHTVKAGETVCVRKPPVTYSFKILKTIEQRVGAKLLPEIAGDEPHQRICEQSQGNGASYEERPSSDGCVCRALVGGRLRHVLR